MPNSTPRTRVSAYRRRMLSQQLSERDWRVLDDLHQHGFLTTAHICGLDFGPHATADTAARTTRRVLARLARDRLIESLPRRQGGPLGGSTPAVWRLTSAGRRIRETHRPALRALTPTHQRVLHSLAVADLHVSVRHAAATTDQAVEVALEPTCWRSFHGLGGERRTVKPDLAITVHGHDAQGPYVDRWFIEVDLGTEHLPTLIAKSRAYHEYYLSGSETKDGRAFPLVLWACSEEQRVSQLARAVARTSGLKPQMFRYCTLDQGDDVITGAGASS
ncbi:MAG: replication-relaxation family protein [Tetrasphaera sp.]|nr:replication-relaxation family protein [Tetrasphaera sp.]